MASEAGIDRTYASQIERGVNNPSLRVICAIASSAAFFFAAKSIVDAMLFTPVLMKFFFADILI